MTMMLLVIVPCAWGMTVSIDRRGALATPWMLPTAAAAASDRKLSDLLAARDATLLLKPVLNIPPAMFAFPPWLEGEWRVTSRFAGYLFTATKISKQRLLTNVVVPGFQKLSIAENADVGKEACEFARRYVSRSGQVREDRAFNYKASIEAHLGEPGIVERVVCDDERNPNRVTIELRPGSRNGERLELFTNSRKSETVDATLFLCSESLRQVTLGGPTFSQPGVARIVIGEYQHFWSFRHRPAEGVVGANVLTAAYIEPQDPMFPEAFNEPVLVYSHDLTFQGAG